MALSGASRQSYETLGDGRYVVVLTEIRESTRDQSRYGKGTEEPCLDFLFETADQMNRAGSPFRIRVRTGTSYGGQQATLTKLFNELVGLKATDLDVWDDTDNEDLVGKRYYALVEEVETSEGRKFNTITNLAPYRKNEAPRPPASEPEADALTDPFEEE